MSKQKLIIAIDGYSSSGKSTLAKEIAKALEYRYIDSGAMYRAVTLFAIRNNVVKNKIVDEKKLKNILNNININFIYNEDLNHQDIFLNNENVEDEIRKMEVSNTVSLISKFAFVREKMVKLQQEMGNDSQIVMDGRDIGTVVFPDADIKIFMTADVESRAKRRYNELIEKGEDVSYEDIFNNVKERDYLDENRTESPLRKAVDAIELDNSNLSREEQFSWIMNILNKYF
jgi:cytidylate kinase